ncbi:uncharacterized protein LOC100217286 [Zea mays]|uniref:Protein XRI1 n=1 Tax=Zea mays TaxID=4577 RepID=A0A1D6KL65_MAIZE|nr:uncharacterized protein LOC100217286 [Zea mays]ONM03632.1 hypothetical protein ZEAMMB73_Zm00001d031753 [Zea mays]|eukprot:XP_008666044.1 uncharacterized protein LOC100217286 isoform X3 [Zea mays]
METAGQTTLQESAVHARRQAACWWPLDTTACSSLDLDDASTFSSSSLLLGWEWDPQLCCFGSPHARDSELFGPTCMESPVSEASAAAATGELDDELLLMSLWGECHLFSSCSALKEKTATSSQRTPKSLQSDDDHHSDLPTSPAKTTPATAQAAEPSHCDVDLRASYTGGAQQQQQQQHRTTRAANSSSKRSATEPEEKGAEGGKRSRKAPGSTAVAAYPFAVVKPGGADGGVTLADINRWILTPPARPVRHPVGEFACAPRVSAANRPGPSGRTVAGFTRLRTAGRGTITIVRTRG